MVRIIILPIDESDHSEKAWHFYRETIRRPDDDVICLHAIEVPYGPDFVMLRTEVIQDILERAKADGKKVEDKFKKLADENQVNIRMISEFGSPGEMIVKKAKEENATMIIMGTRGMGKIRRTILGSVSDYVVHHAPCPVTVTRG